MEYSRFSKMMLIADLSLCCIWLLCVFHGSTGEPQCCRPVIWALPLLRIWLSFLIYRRSRMALAPIVMLTVLTVGVLSGRALSGNALFIDPLLLLLRIVPTFFGDSVITADNIQEITWTMSEYVVKVGIAFSVWLILIPLGVYVGRCFSKNEQGSFSLGKRAGLYAYIVAVIIVISLIVTVFRYSFVSVFMLSIFLMLIPVIFNKGKLDELLTEREQMFIMALVMSGVAYTCGVGYDDASTIAAILLSALFYVLVCRIIAHKVEYKDVLHVLSASFLFVCSQYAISMYRVILLLLSQGFMSVAMIRLTRSSGRYWTSAAVYVVIAVVLPVFSLGYNPCSVMEAGKVSHYDSYEYAPNGLMMVSGREGIGIRDRYGLILPPEYEAVEHLISSKPYCKVMKDGEWMIYDIVRQMLLTEERFADVIPCGEYTYKLTSASCDKYLIIPRRYSRYNDACVAVIADVLPTGCDDKNGFSE